MALAPDLQTIVESYKFSDAERQDLKAYLTEEAKQLERCGNDEDFDYSYAIALHKVLTDNAKSFTSETSEYMTAWHYSELDIVEALRDMINELERSVIC